MRQLATYANSRRPDVAGIRYRVKEGIMGMALKKEGVTMREIYDRVPMARFREVAKESHAEHYL